MPGCMLVPATGTEFDEPVFATALTAARLLSAHLQFLHVRIDVQATLTAMATADMGGGVGSQEILDSLEQEVKTRQKPAELAFRALCDRERLPVSADPAAALPSAEWLMETGDEPEWLAEHG